jgi:hypothetical protein
MSWWLRVPFVVGEVAAELSDQSSFRLPFLIAIPPLLLASVPPPLDECISSQAAQYPLPYIGVAGTKPRWSALQHCIHKLPLDSVPVVTNTGHVYPPGVREDVCKIENIVISAIYFICKECRLLGCYAVWLL